MAFFKIIVCFLQIKLHDKCFESILITEAGKEKQF